MGEQDGKISWMYDGLKGSVNREDYLLGKRVGKDLSALSDTIRPDDDSAHQRSIEQSLTKNLSDRKSPPRGGLLTLTNIQCEDPMFGIKVSLFFQLNFIHISFQLAEERARRKKIDNPYLQMKLRKAINEELEESKKKKHKHRKFCCCISKTDFDSQIKSITRSILSTPRNRRNPVLLHTPIRTQILKMKGELDIPSTPLSRDGLVPEVLTPKRTEELDILNTLRNRSDLVHPPVLEVQIPKMTEDPGREDVRRENEDD